MIARVASALIFVPVFVGVCAWGATPFAILMAVTAALGACEMYRAFAARGIRPNPALAAIGPCIALLPAGGALGLGERSWQVWPYAGLVAAAPVAWELVRASRTGEMQLARNIAYGLLCGVYSAMFASIGWLRTILGFGPTMLVVCMVWATDTAALYCGKALGRHKLAPTLSPAKTIEGALGGVIAAAAIGAIGSTIAHTPMLNTAVIGALVSVAGQAGDLLESALKREVCVKDFGSVIPGHGGALDRFDSLIFVCTVLAAAFPYLAAR